MYFLNGSGGGAIVVLSDIEFHEASTLEQAAELMARCGTQARFLAGGTSLVVDLKSDRYRADHVISLNRISSLRGISAADNGVRIGALTTLNEVATSDLIREKCLVIREAAREMASPQIRNLGTVGGNIVGAVPCADMPPVMAVMHATVNLWSPSGVRNIPIEAFFVGPRETVRRSDEILTEVIVPQPPARFGAAYARFGLREANSVAVAAVAASLLLKSDGTVDQARICLSAVAGKPTMVADAQSALAGTALDESSLNRAAEAAMATAQPISDVRGSAGYRRELIGTLTRRALLTAQKRAAGEK
jgi:aerobic carbon-monoxide dehydrogenase medium subunit